jgi:hypothetical protein
MKMTLNRICNRLAICQILTDFHFYSIYAKEGYKLNETLQIKVLRKAGVSNG